MANPGQILMLKTFLAITFAGLQKYESSAKGLYLDLFLFPKRKSAPEKEKGVCFADWKLKV